MPVCLFPGGAMGLSVHDRVITSSGNGVDPLRALRATYRPCHLVVSMLFFWNYSH